MATKLPVVAQKLGRNIRRIVAGLLLTGWTAGWGLVTVVGWAASSGGIFYTGLTMMAAGLLGAGTSYAVSRRRLQARAQTSLIARADLKQLALEDSMATRLHVFDDAWQTMQPSLNDPSLPHADRSAEVIAELSAAQDQLFALAERHSALRRELGQLSLYGASDLVETSRSAKQAELTRVEGEAEALVGETQKLAATAEQVRALSAGRAGEATERLKEAVSQFDITLSAYREVEGALQDPSEKAKALAAKAQRQSQGSS